MVEGRDGNILKMKELNIYRENNKMPQKSTKIYQKRNFPYEKCLIPIKYRDSKQFIKASYSWNKKKSKKKS